MIFAIFLCIFSKKIAVLTSFAGISVKTHKLLVSVLFLTSWHLCCCFHHCCCLWACVASIPAAAGVPLVPDVLRGASKIKLKNVNKKRKATARRFFSGISQGNHC